jgi:hypothetical protein
MGGRVKGVGVMVGLECVVSGGVLNMSSPPKSESRDDFVSGRMDVGERGGFAGLLRELVFELSRAKPPILDVFEDL